MLTNSSRPVQIRTEGIRAQLDNLPQSSLSSIVMGVVVAATAYEHTGGLFALSWLACIVVLSACRLLIWRHYKAAGLAADIERLGRYAVAASRLSGLIWGVGSFIAFFLAPSHMHSLIVPMIIMLGAVATFAGNSYLPAFYVFFYTAALPAILTFFIANRYVLGVGFLLYTVFVTRMVKANHQRYREGVGVRLDNVALVAALTEKTRKRSRPISPNHASLRLPAMTCASPCMRSRCSSKALQARSCRTTKCNSSTICASRPLQWRRCLMLCLMYRGSMPHRRAAPTARAAQRPHAATAHRIHAAGARP